MKKETEINSNFISYRNDTPSRFHAWAVPIGLFILFAFYQYTYSTYEPVPGNSLQYPLGWWGWFDQGQYWLSIKALAALNFSPENHLYPPLYPLLGALFSPFTDMHQLYLINLLLIFGYFLVACKLFGRHIGTAPAAVCVLLGMLGYGVVGLQWVIPWTSTLGAFLLISCISLLDRFDRIRTTSARLSDLVLNAFVFGLVVGALIPTRPADIVTAAPAALAYATLALLFAMRDSKKGLAVIAAGITGTIIPFLFFVTFNILSTGSPQGRYFDSITTSTGFDVTQLPERLFSLLVASQVYFLEFDADWLSVIPLYSIVVVVAIVSVLFRVPLFMRIGGCMMLVHFAIYASYRDSVPTGMFRYYNIHYYKWMFPFAVCLFAYYLRPSMFKRRGARVIATGAVLTLLITSTTVAPRGVPISRFSTLGLEADLVFSPRAERLSVVDMPLQTPERGVALTYKTLVTLNGVLLNPISEYRVVANETTVRLIVYRGENVGSLNVKLPDLVTPPVSGWVPHAFAMPFAIGWPLSQQALETSNLVTP